MCILFLTLEECSKAIENIRSHNEKLVSSFPIDDLLPNLYSKKVIDEEEKKAMQKEKLERNKVSFLFDQVVLPELENGVNIKYDSIINVLEESENSTVKNLAKLLKGN